MKDSNVVLIETCQVADNDEAEGAEDDEADGAELEDDEEEAGVDEDVGISLNL